MKSIRMAVLSALGCAALGLMVPAPVQAELMFVEDASGRKSPSFRDLIQWTHSRCSGQLIPDSG